MSEELQNVKLIVTGKGLWGKVWKSSSPRRPADILSSMKAKTSAHVSKFQDIPNIGPAMVRDFQILGLTKPKDLIRKDPFQLYKQMCIISGKRHDPCVLDTYIAAIDFMNGAPPRPWFFYTKGRRKKYPNI